jgi:site-specific DNA recombinase
VIARQDRSTKAAVRCAIYTRKSTEEGLEQEFNSLDAQRESAEAYIASQKAEGWTCLPHRYDDGGFSGGTIERPALKRLMADIEAGEIDCVVVYKVDRLSRSLLDFARLMGLFDSKGISFVSVTQQFNTANSMGRLMLNVLLSFAQFEREIISERTRDKIAAARRKGKWAGGRPVLGYDLVSRPGGGKLVVNDGEAVIVREIFSTYLSVGSLIPLVRACRDRGWTTKAWATKAGKPQGGRPLDKGRLYSMLTNPVYTGKVRHHDDVFDGEHEAIIDDATFAAVGEMLRSNGRDGGSQVRNKHGALLKGLVRCKACECGMGHHYASKATDRGAARYRYYVCQKAQKQGWNMCPGASIPANDLEDFVVGQIRAALAGDGAIDAVVERARMVLSETDPDRVIDPDEAVGAAEAFDPIWDALNSSERAELLRQLVRLVEWDAEAELVTVHFGADAESETATEGVS